MGPLSTSMAPTGAASQPALPPGFNPNFQGGPFGGQTGGGTVTGTYGTLSGPNQGQIITGSNMSQPSTLSMGSSGLSTGGPQLSWAGNPQLQGQGLQYGTGGPDPLGAGWFGQAANQQAMGNNMAAYNNLPGTQAANAHILAQAQGGGMQPGYVQPSSVQNAGQASQFNQNRAASTGTQQGQIMQPVGGQRPQAYGSAQHSPALSGYYAQFGGRPLLGMLAGGR